MEADFLAALRTALVRGDLRTDAASLIAYGYDNSREQVSPDAVVVPADTDEVAGVVRACAAHGVPLTARGLGSATTGAAVPIRKGVVIAFERMKRILELQPDDRTMVVQPGCLNSEVQRAAAEAGFFWAPDPTSAPYSTIGGNLACNAAGPRAVKYGTSRENTLGLQVVTGTGAVIRVGGKTSKGVVGFDLTRLLIGSEGTLALITEATLKLTPLQPARATLRAVYRDVESAAAAVAAIMSGPVTPCALEFMDRRALDIVRATGAVEIDTSAHALLLVECDGVESELAAQLDSVGARARNEGALEVTTATDPADIEALWQCRRALSPAQRKLKPHKINEDVVVPVSRLPQLVRGIGKLAEKYQILILSFGHAGNGNLHVNLLGDDSDLDAMHRCLPELFQLTLGLGGTISGEHGIGLVKKAFIGLELETEVLRLMRGVKHVFDPHGILNPGKVFPDE